MKIKTDQEIKNLNLNLSSKFSSMDIESASMLERKLEKLMYKINPKSKSEMNEMYAPTNK